MPRTDRWCDHQVHHVPAAIAILRLAELHSGELVLRSSRWTYPQSVEYVVDKLQVFARNAGTERGGQTARSRSEGTISLIDQSIID